MDLSLEQNVDKQLMKIEDLKDFYNIVCDEDEKRSLFALNRDVVRIKCNMERSKSIIESYPERRQKVDELIMELKRQEIIMKLVLEKLDSQPPVKIEATGMVTPQIKKPRPEQRQSSVKKLPWSKNQAAPMSARKSISKHDPQIQVNVPDFEYNITEGDFNDIPKYLRGREAQSELQRTIDEIVCPCFIEKYTILGKPNSQNANFNQRQLRKHFLDQQDYFPGHYFITDGDLARFTQTLIDKKLRTRIQMLRQIGILKEARKNSTVCFIWLVRAGD